MNPMQEVESFLEKVVAQVCAENVFIIKENSSKNLHDFITSEKIITNQELNTNIDFSSSSDPHNMENNYLMGSNEYSECKAKLDCFKKSSNRVQSSKYEEVCCNFTTTSNESDNTKTKNFFNSTKTEETIFVENSEELLNLEIKRAFEKYDALFEQREKSMKDVSVQTALNSNSVPSGHCTCQISNSDPQINETVFFGSIFALTNEQEQEWQTTGKINSNHDEEITKEKMDYSWKVPAKRIRIGLSKNVKPKSLYSKLM